MTHTEHEPSDCLASIHNLSPPPKAERFPRSWVSTSYTSLGPGVVDAANIFPHIGDTPRYADKEICKLGWDPQSPQTSTSIPSVFAAAHYPRDAVCLWLK